MREFPESQERGHQDRHRNYESQHKGQHQDQEPHDQKKINLFVEHQVRHLDKTLAQEKNKKKGEEAGREARIKFFEKMSGNNFHRILDPPREGKSRDGSRPVFFKSFGAFGESLAAGHDVVH